MLKCRFCLSRALPLGAAAEEETLPPKLFLQITAESSALSSRLAWKMETPQPCRTFFTCQGNGWSHVEDASGPPASQPNGKETLGSET